MQDEIKFIVTIYDGDIARQSEMSKDVLAMIHNALTQYRSQDEDLKDFLLCLLDGAIYGPHSENLKQRFLSIAKRL